MVDKSKALALPINYVEARPLTPPEGGHPARLRMLTLLDDMDMNLEGLLADFSDDNVPDLGDGIYDEDADLEQS